MNDENTQNSENNNNQTNKKKSGKWLFAIPISIALVISTVLYIIFFKTDFLKNLLETPILGIFLAIILVLIPIALIILGLFASVGGFVANEVMEKVDELSSSSNPKDKKKADAIVMVIVIIIGIFMYTPTLKKYYYEYFQLPEDSVKVNYAVFANDDKVYYISDMKGSVVTSFLRETDTVSNKDKKLLKFYGEESLIRPFLINNNKLYYYDNYDNYFELDLKTKKTKEFNFKSHIVKNTLHNKYYMYATKSVGPNHYLQIVDINNFSVVKEQKLAMAREKKYLYYDPDTLNTYFAYGTRVYHNDKLIYKMPGNTSGWGYTDYDVVYVDGDDIYLRLFENLEKVNGLPVKTHGALYVYNEKSNQVLYLGTDNTNLKKIESNNGNDVFYWDYEKNIYTFNEATKQMEILIKGEYSIDYNSSYLHSYRSRDYIVFSNEILNVGEYSNILVYNEKTKRIDKYNKGKYVYVDDTKITILVENENGKAETFKY